MKYLITYEDALKLCEAYKNFNFFKTEHMFGPYKAVTFNYFLCEYNNFVKPLPAEPHINGRDMRGVTFVFNADGTLYKRFLMLEKFFNVNQVEETQIYDLRKKKIRNVTIKEDGSLIAFMQLPNGEVFAKTQGGFTNSQANAAMALYNHQKDIKRFVDDALETGFTPLFEFVSYDNRIVLKYKTKELRLIGVRDNDYGDYYPAVEMLYVNENYDIPIAKAMNVESLDELDAMMKTATDMEGVVVKFEDDQLVKWKTAWYFSAHKFRDDINKENFIIKLILNNQMDDFIVTIDIPEQLEQIKTIEKIINIFMKNKSIEIKKLCETYKGNKKEFVLQNKSNKNLSFALLHLFNNKEINDIISEYLKKKTNRLQEARHFIENGYI